MKEFTQYDDRRRSQLLHPRDQDDLRSRPNLPHYRSSRPPLKEDHDIDEEPTSSYRVQVDREESEEEYQG